MMMIFVVYLHFNYCAFTCFQLQHYRRVQVAVASCGILSVQFDDYSALAPSRLFSRLMPGYENIVCFNTVIMMNRV